MSARQRILVTGSAGYIGAVLVPVLERAGHSVTPLDLGLFGEATFESAPDLSDRRDVRQVERPDLEGHDAVIHLAALSNDPVGNLDPSLTHEINHRASVRLAELAKACGVRRFLFSSSCSLYGAHGEALVDETAPFAPVTPYAESKVLVEAALDDLADDHFVPTYLRNATVYGPSPALRLDVVVNNLTARAVATRRIVLESDGTPWRPQVHIEDVVTAFQAVLEAPENLVHRQAFNVGVDGENYQVRELAEIVAEVVEGAVVEFAPGAGPDTRSYRVDFSKLRQRIETFVPRWTVRKGVAELAARFRSAGLDESSFNRYIRLAEIRRLQAAGRLTTQLGWQVKGAVS